MDRANVSDVAGKRIAALSKGFKQRVGLAQAIVHEPPVLILDEPTSSLDPKQRVEVRDLIVGLRGEHTVVLSTHILPEVSQITDRVVIINRGRVMAVDSPQNLSQRLRGREEVTVEVGGAARRGPQAVAAVPGVVRVRPTSRAACRARIQSDLGTDVRADVARVLATRWRLLALRSESLSLEEIFLKLTEDDKVEGRGCEGATSVRHVIAIARRELRSYFVSPIAYVAVTAYALLSGFLSTAGLTTCGRRAWRTARSSSSGARRCSSTCRR